MADKYSSTLLAADNTKTEINKAVLDLLKKINGLDADLQSAAADALAAAAPPVGAIYVQGPGDTDPGTLWPSTTWSNVSSEEAGSFRRFEGGAALAFGGGQQGFAMQDHIHYSGLGTLTGADNMKIYSLTATDAPGAATTHLDFLANAPDKQPVTSGPKTGGGGTPVVASETRSVNYTVRKWRRTA